MLLSTAIVVVSAVSLCVLADGYLHPCHPKTLAGVLSERRSCLPPPLLLEREG